MSVGKIYARYVEEALLPMNAIVGDTSGEVETKDGVRVHLNFIKGMDNRGQYCIEDLDDYCQRRYGMGFSRYEAGWRWALDGAVSDFWYIVKMEKA